MLPCLMFKSDRRVVKWGVTKVRCGTVVRKNFIDNVRQVKLSGGVVAQSHITAMFQQMFHAVEVSRGRPLLRQSDKHNTYVRSTIIATVLDTQ